MIFHKNTPIVKEMNKTLYNLPIMLKVLGGGKAKYMREVRKNHTKVGKSVYDQRKKRVLKETILPAILPKT